MSLIFASVAFAAVAVFAWIGYQLLLQNGRILLQLRALQEQLETVKGQVAVIPTSVQQRPPGGLQIGTRAPEFELPDLAGALHRLSDWSGRKVLLIFFNPDCGFCREMVSMMKSMQSRDDVLPIVVSTGAAGKNAQIIQENDFGATWLLQRETEVAAQYAASGTPMGYLIDERGFIATPLRVGAPQLLEILALTVQPPSPSRGTPPAHVRTDLSQSKIERNGLSPGSVAPEFELPFVGGGELRLSAFRGRKVLLVFSDPGCGPCQALSAQLGSAWSAEAPFALLMVSRGTREENLRKVEGHGLRFPVVLQRHWEISRLYAFFATPVGYLIDEDGRIATNAAVGVDAIMALVAKVTDESLVPASSI